MVYRIKVRKWWIFLLSGVVMLGIISSCGETSLAEIHLEGPPWEHMKSRKKEKVTLHYKAGEDYFDLSATINRRGGMSYSFDKYSFTLFLDRKLPLGFLPMDNDWVLNASYIDKTFMRHRLAYELFREMDQRFLSPRSSYVRLFYNDNYKGLYVLMEKPDVSTLQIDKKASKACIFKDPPLFTAYEKTIVIDSSNFFEQKFPDPTKRDKNEELHRLKKFLFYSTDEVFEQEIERYFDIKNILDWHLLLLFTNNSDGILKNFYLYRQNNSSLYRIAIWDYDHSFGRDGDNELNLIRPLDPSRSILIKRLLALNVSNYRCRLAKRWQELRAKDILTAANVQQMMQSNQSIIEEEIKRNAQVWPLDGKWYYDQNNFYQELEIINQFLERRIPQLESYFQKMEQDCLSKEN